ncbi:unnamed protein product [Prunus armeniaca]|uniref:Uncharacterized protein n=1 Tax=Prunus armeniaca TaxID=36596 RepID=A0A6J5VYQ8_PRUAR|nr:unnamed protein product [Prunus armeniaca]
MALGHISENRSFEHAGELIQWLAFGLWRIWKCRNEAIFEGKSIDPQDVALWSKQVPEFGEMQALKKLQQCDMINMV